MPPARPAHAPSAGALARLAVVAVGLCTALGAACARTPLDGGGGDPAAATAGGIEKIRIAENFEATMWKLDPYTIESATIAGDELTLVVQRGGGCAQHEYTLVASRGFRESFPVQSAVVLTHDAAGDMCRALVTDTLRFDLTPLRDLYRADYHTQKGTIILHLWHQERTVRYDF